MRATGASPAILAADVVGYSRLTGEEAAERAALADNCSAQSRLPIWLDSGLSRV